MNSIRNAWRFRLEVRGPIRNAGWFRMQSVAAAWRQPRPRSTAGLSPAEKEEEKAREKALAEELARKRLESLEAIIPRRQFLLYVSAVYDPLRLFLRRKRAFFDLPVATTTPCSAASCNACSFRLAMF